MGFNCERPSQSLRQSIKRQRCICLDCPDSVPISGAVRSDAQIHINDAASLAPGLNHQATKTSAAEMVRGVYNY